MSTVPVYTSDLTAMSDAEMEVLAAELVEAYRVSDYGYGYEWTDAKAEARYDAMQDEKHRRFMLANPDWNPVTVSEFIQKLNERTAKVFANMTYEVRIIGDTPAAKIGDAVTIRKS